MTRSPLVARKAEQLLGSAVVATAPVAGGDISTATRLRLSDGRSVFMKTHHHAPDGFFAAEARGLQWLAEAGSEAAGVAQVLGHDQECLITEWVEPGRATPEAAEDLGRRLARTHTGGPEQARPSAYGAEQEGFIGRLPMPGGTTSGWAEFYATKRLLPYLKLARDRGAIGEDDAAAVEALVPRLGDLVPDEGPARLHGDLWNGNVLWSAEGGAYLIDPAAHAGHRETDLAMLALFGLPNLQRMLDAYQEVAPLAEGWEDRVGLHQLYPLLVHACLFGGGYGARAGAIAAEA